MTLGNKLSKLRKEHNFTQEQLAELLGVSRQAVSRWESGLAYPETEKIIRLGELYDCSLDYLLKEDMEEDIKDIRQASASVIQGLNGLNSKNFFYEYKSTKKIGTLPLIHVNIGMGRCAKGVLAVGIRAKGIVAFGMLSLGVVSGGILSLGILSIGTVAVGALALGSFALGILALGALTLGVVSAGAVSVGLCSAGALAIGKYVAMGDEARATIALGSSRAVGTLWESTHSLSLAEYEEVCRLIEETVPPFWEWAGKIMQWLLRLAL